MNDSVIKALLVEGASQQGKTNLCKYLSKMTGWPVVAAKDDYSVHEFTITDSGFLSAAIQGKLKNTVGVQNKLLKTGVILINVDRLEMFRYSPNNTRGLSRQQTFAEIAKFRNLYPKLFMYKIQINPNLDMKLVFELLRQFKLLKNEKTKNSKSGKSK